MHGSEHTGTLVGAIGFGAAGIVSTGLTWSDIWAPMAFILTLLVAAIGTIWAMHQRELGALKSQIERFDAKLDGKLDGLQKSINELSVGLARDYTPRADLEKLRDELHARKAG